MFWNSRGRTAALRAELRSANYMAPNRESFSITRNKNNQEEKRRRSSHRNWIENPLFRKTRKQCPKERRSALQVSTAFSPSPWAWIEPYAKSTTGSELSAHCVAHCGPQPD